MDSIYTIVRVILVFVSLITLFVCLLRYSGWLFEVLF